MQTVCFGLYVVQYIFLYFDILLLFYVPIFESQSHWVHQSATVLTHLRKLGQEYQCRIKRVGYTHSRFFYQWTK